MAAVPQRIDQAVTGSAGYRLSTSRPINEYEA